MATYAELYEEVCPLRQWLLKAQNVKKGDRVTIYLPMIPEATYAMLACARIGAVHSVVFAGFSPDSLAGRIQDCASTIVITSDEGVRGGRPIPLKANTDAAVAKCPDVKTVLVVKHTGGKIDMKTGRDVWYHDVSKTVPAECKPEEMSAEDPLFILYTSGSTGKPKGVLHTSGGYLLYSAMTHRYVFDYHDGDIYWCTADVGWVTGHSYIVYGPLANGATTLMFEGVPNYPTSSRFWEVIDKHKVNIFYTAPTAIRALMREGEAPVRKTSRKSLRLLGSVGEPINPEAWLWYYKTVGDLALPHRRHVVADGNRRHTHLAAAGRNRSETGIGDEAAIRYQAAACRCRRKDSRRRRQRQSRSARLLAGPDAHCVWRSPALRNRNLFQGLSRQIFPRRRLPPPDEDGYYWITEAASTTSSMWPAIASAQPKWNPRWWRITRWRKRPSSACRTTSRARASTPATLKVGVTPSDALAEELKQFVAKQLSPIAKPDVIQFATGLPKSRSGKIMRIILRKIAYGDMCNLGDFSTLADPAVVEDLVKNAKHK